MRRHSCDERKPRRLPELHTDHRAQRASSPLPPPIPPSPPSALCSWRERGLLRRPRIATNPFFCGKAGALDGVAVAVKTGWICRAQLPTGACDLAALARGTSCMHCLFNARAVARAVPWSGPCPVTAPRALLFQVDAAFTGPMSLSNVAEFDGNIQTRVCTLAPLNAGTIAGGWLEAGPWGRAIGASQENSHPPVLYARVMGQHGRVVLGCARLG